jgi:hypothetical protein
MKKQADLGFDRLGLMPSARFSCLCIRNGIDSPTKRAASSKKKRPSND